MPVYYHVTTKSAIAGIKQRGILPSLARGKRKVVWLCNGEKLAWALLHITKHQKRKPQNMRVLRVILPRESLKSWSMKGVYTCDKVIKPFQIEVL